MKWKKNLGSRARLLYVAVGVALLIAAGVAGVSGAWRLALSVAGILLTAEGAVGF
ncbi:MAG: hypothetical protein ACE5MH_10195 [Terriglobia bacterium]